MIYTVTGTWTVCIDCIEADTEEEARDKFYDIISCCPQNFEITSVEREEE